MFQTKVREMQAVNNNGRNELLLAHNCKHYFSTKMCLYVFMLSDSHPYLNLFFDFPPPLFFIHSPSVFFFITVTCKTVSILNGMVYSNSPEIVWNAEPKNVGKKPKSRYMAQKYKCAMESN